jgi:hypothetical protein
MRDGSVIQSNVMQQCLCLIVIENDVEENPRPTVYDVVDPTQTVCADFNQGDTYKKIAGKQCLAISLTAIIHSHILIKC